MADDKVFTISEFIAFLNLNLKATKVRISGEVGEAKAGPTGHMYFTLKEAGNDASSAKATAGQGAATLSCIMWAGKYKLFGINLQAGQKITALGNPEVYAANGRLSFICETIEFTGEGDLKKQYDELKEKLTKEGLFDVSEKRDIPKFPQKIGVITSKNGAVIHDFLNNIGKFGFNIKLIDSRVEGQGAVEDLLKAIKAFRNENLDVLVIIRGGGSIESLMPFNNEMLVREVVGFPVPVVVGIGHDQDVPLVALAADVAESTPTAVANLLNQSWQQAQLYLERYERTIFTKFTVILQNSKNLVLKIIEIIKKGGQIIFEKYQKAENQFRISLQNFKNFLQNAKMTIDYAEKIITSNNPEKQLKLGYSIATVNGKVVRRIEDVKMGDNLKVKVFDGEIESEVKNIK